MITILNKFKKDNKTRLPCQARYSDNFRGEGLVQWEDPWIGYMEIGREHAGQGE
jgi:hypothetical protein